MPSITSQIQAYLPYMKSYFLRDQMKTKNFYLVILFILATATTIIFLGNPAPNLHTIVSETHKQFSNIKNIPTNIRYSNAEDFNVNPTYLMILGFKNIDISGLPDSKKENESKPKEKLGFPVIATSVDPARPLEQVDQLITSVKKYLPNKHVVLFDLGLGGSGADSLKQMCNKTGICQVRAFPFENFPSHVKYLGTHSYRPICIQEMLNEYGSVIWADPSEYFISGDMDRSIKQAQKVGISAWTIDDPTSALTHPKMFEFFKTKKEKYYFHHAVKSTHLIIYNTDRVHRELMLPWVKCALTEECIDPTGAQSSGCTDRRPRYMYSGCHKYDMSSLNVILGILFDYVSNEYASEDKLFGVLSPGSNATSPKYFTKAKLSQV
ncbi:hypothetical protein CHS0354_040383 [Potamilus streckersoni]|uniref:Uncharacterized protein n=1 Tax=Potamilus streckersoni TaxID=2493646 RepID=A0AAE0S1L0_9BIVA|nr:hypothetical protein CHS0354_040383 [Potamilus streckersoni]